MRSRLVRPEFWSDSLVAQLPDPVRLLYIGLWCVADDAGYLEWDYARIGSELMPYRMPTARAKRVEQLSATLIESGRVRLLECGRHAVIPSLERHAIAGGNKSERVRNEHSKVCPTRVRTMSGLVRTPSTDKSRSESSSLSLSESDSPSPRRRANGLTPSGGNGKDDRLDRIARARATLDRADADEKIKDVARAELQRLGATA